MMSRVTTTPNSIALTAAPTDTTWMKEAFSNVRAALRAKMTLAHQSVSHAGTMGAVNEDHWVELLRSYLPNRYEVATGIIIDSTGDRSDQIDVVIFDRHFTPTLLDQKNHRYIPAEAVYAVFECKPEVNKNYIEYAQGKAASVRKMTRTSVPISHAGGTYPAKPHFRILAGLLAPTAGWTTGLGKTFLKNLGSAPDSSLDCICALDHGSYDRYSGSPLVVSDDAALIFFLFRLLDRLQSLGSVPAIDWAAYSRIVHP
jgi:hypothetical protein